MSLGFEICAEVFEGATRVDSRLSLLNRVSGVGVEPEQVIRQGCVEYNAVVHMASFAGKRGEAEFGKNMGANRFGRGFCA